MTFKWVSLATALVVGCGATALLTGSARADDLIVVNASDSAFHPGDKVANDKSISIPDGQSVTLVSADGDVMTLKGPFNGAPQAAVEAKTASVTDMLKPLLAQGTAEKATPGVIRGDVHSPDVDAQVIDTVHDSEVCVHPALSYSLWRPNPPGTPAETASIQPAGGGDATAVNFDAGKDLADLPDSMTFTDGGHYKITRANRSVMVTVHLVPASLPTDDSKAKMMAAYFAQRSCAVQARALAKSIASAN